MGESANATAIVASVNGASGKLAFDPGSGGSPIISYYVFSPNDVFLEAGGFAQVTMTIYGRPGSLPLSIDLYAYVSVEGLGGLTTFHFTVIVS